MPIPRVDLFIDGAWVDVSTYVLYEAGIVVKHGRQSESGTIEPDTAALTFKNFDYRFTPLHPSSPYFDQLQRNTPIRIANDSATVDTTESTYMYLPGSQGAYAHCADSAGVSVTGDIEIQIDVALDDWSGTTDLCTKYRVDINDRSWFLYIDGGFLKYVWSANGTAITTATATVALSLNPGDRKAIKVTHDVNNGAAGNDVKFYTAPTIGGSYTQLGATVTTAGTTSIFDSSEDVAVGFGPGGGGTLAGKVYGFKLLSGIGGTVKASPDFTAQTDQTTSFTDAQSNEWFVDGAAQMVTTTPGPWRYHGEVANWPVESEITGRYVTVTVEAAGQWRRLSQNDQPLKSAMRRAHTNPSLTRVKGYWSLEDGTDSSRIASNWAQGYGSDMKISGSPALADNSEWTASDALVTLGSASIFGEVISYTTTGESGVYFFFDTDYPGTGAPAAETSLFRVYCSGTIAYFDIRLLVNGNMRVKAYDRAGTAFDDGAGNLDAELGMDVLPRGFLLMNFELLKSGSDTVWYMAVNDFTGTDVITGALGASFFTGTIAGETFTRVRKVTLNADKADLSGIHVGHLVVSDKFKLTLTDVGDAVTAYNGENPATRVLRLCGEENIPVDLISQNAVGNGVSLGDQLLKPLTGLLTEAADTDLGILYESRGRLALAYRTRLSLVNQDPAVTLSHSAHELGDTLRPTTDDQLTVNEQYVLRDKGVTAYAAKTTGKMRNVSPKAGGIGSYSAERTASLTYDQQVADQASFRLLLGTQEKPRCPTVVVNLHHPSIAGTSLYDDLIAIDVGDRLVITDMPAYLPPDDVDLLVVGYSERFDQFTHQIIFNCQPYEPWQWAIWDDDNARYDTAGSATSGSFAAGTDSSLTVTTSSGPVWIDSAAYPTHFPFNIRTGGAVLHVTAVTGTTSPQTFTVTRRTLNGRVSTLVISDTFTRSVSGGHGTPETGSPWLTSGGAAGDFSVTGTKGRVAPDSVNVRRFTYSTTSYTDVDMYATVTVPATATGGSIAMSLVARRTDDNNFYMVQLLHDTSGTIDVELNKRVTGTFTTIASTLNYIAYTAGTPIWVHFRVVRSTLQCKVWAGAITDEPSTWLLTGTATNFGTGSVGTHTNLVTGNTNTTPVNCDYDDLTVYSVTAGVEKTIPSGSNVELDRKAYVGMV